MTPIPRQPWRFALAGGAFACLLGGLGLRLNQLALVDGTMLAEMGRRQASRTWTIPAARGSLLDSKGTPLVESLGSWTLLADPDYMNDKLRATVELSRITGLPRGLLRQEFEQGRNGRTLARDLDEDQAAAIRNLEKSGALTGTRLVRGFTRISHEGNAAAHVLGFTLADGKGGAGIELRFEPVLAGSPGRESLRIDALGRPMLDGSDCIAPVAGAHIQLTLDLGLQRILEKHLAEAVAKHVPQSAAAVLLRPATGEIAAMASWPAFDPGTREGLGPESLRNGVIGYVYEPGSTMKPLIAGAAIAERLTTLGTSIDCERGAWTYREGRSSRTVHEKTGGHGVLTVTQVIALSDNIGMAKLGIALGPERLKDWTNRLGFGRPSGIPLPGEEGGIVPRGRWTNLNEGMSVPMGHNVSVTPLQLALAHAAIANAGIWNPPRLVKRIFRPKVDGGEEDLPLPGQEPPRRIFPGDTAAAVQEAMTHTMIEGTGKRSALDGYSSAGKTGTAEKIIDGRYSDRNVCSFVCWAPAEPGVRSELLCLVVIDDPSKGGRFGSDTAAPVVQKVLQESLEQLRVPKKAEASQPGAGRTPR